MIQSSNLMSYLPNNKLKGRKIYLSEHNRTILLKNNFEMKKRKLLDKRIQQLPRRETLSADCFKYQSIHQSPQNEPLLAPLPKSQIEILRHLNKKMNIKSNNIQNNKYEFLKKYLNHLQQEQNSIKINRTSSPKQKKQIKNSSKVEQIIKQKKSQLHRNPFFFCIKRTKNKSEKKKESIKNTKQLQSYSPDSDYIKKSKKYLDKTKSAILTIQQSNTMKLNTDLLNYTPPMIKIAYRKKRTSFHSYRQS